MLERIAGAVLALLLVAGVARAQDAAPSAEEQEAAVAAFLSSLNFKQGEIDVPEAGARFRLGEQFRYLAAADARRVLEDFWSNPPDESVLGMVVPAGTSLADAHAWAVVVTYSDDGYVSDGDAAEIDYAELLSDMKQGTADENETRREMGYETVDLVGWAAPPRYDAAAKKLHWAKELAFAGNAEHTLNYDIRVLGREGYLSLNAVAAISDLATVNTGMEQLLTQVEFDAGRRYADHNPGTDKVAAYGLAALIGGGLAAKTGLFAKLAALLLAGKKIVIPLLIGAGALVMRLFKSKKSDGAVR